MTYIPFYVWKDNVRSYFNILCIYNATTAYTSYGKGYPLCQKAVSNIKSDILVCGMCMIYPHTLKYCGILLVGVSKSNANFSQFRIKYWNIRLNEQTHKTKWTFERIDFYFNPVSLVKLWICFWFKVNKTENTKSQMPYLILSWKHWLKDVLRAIHQLRTLYRGEGEYD